MGLAVGDNDDRNVRRFVASYLWVGAVWSVDIYAYDWDDAQARCKVLNVKLDGELVGGTCIPVRPHWLRSLISRFANFMHPIPVVYRQD